MVGWLLPMGATKSHTHTSPLGAEARMLKTRSRTGSASAVKPLASCAASAASRGASRTDGQWPLLQPRCEPAFGRSELLVSGHAPALVLASWSSGRIVPYPVGSGSFADPCGWVATPEDVFAPVCGL